MKASDICVGDWVYIYTFPNDNPKQDDLFPAKVSAVSVFDIFFDPDDVVVELVIERTKGIASRPLDTCLPIELTEEILVKNGFERDENNQCIFKQNFKPQRFEIEYIGWSDGRWSSHHLVIKYVHQLQHLLQLCGIEKEIEL